MKNNYKMYIPGWTLNYGRYVYGKYYKIIQMIVKFEIKGDETLWNGSSGLLY